MYDNAVIIDSNFILLPFQFKIDYFKEIYLMLEGKTCFIIFKQILNELEAKRKRDSRANKFYMQLKSGLSYLDLNKDKYNIVFDNSVKLENDTTDTFLIMQCDKLKLKYKHVFLATNDSILRKQAKSFGISTIFLRQQRYLSID